MGGAEGKLRLKIRCFLRIGGRCGDERRQDSGGYSGGSSTEPGDEAPASRRLGRSARLRSCLRNVFVTGWLALTGFMFNHKTHPGPPRGTFLVFVAVPRD